jgi:hypothetical protein
MVFLFSYCPGKQDFRAIWTLTITVRGSTDAAACVSFTSRERPDACSVTGLPCIPAVVVIT